MYEQANTSINEGLSLGARIVLGSFSALFGAGLVLVGTDSLHPVGIIGSGIFCILIAVACVARGRLRQFVGSAIGASIFLIGIVYLLDQILAGRLLSGSRSEPSVLNAILYLVFIGIPGLVYASRAKFGLQRQP